jgi:hypothetical protein
METTLDPSKPQRSLFVTVVAWVFIVLAGLGTIVAAFQNVMVFVMIPTESMERMMSQAENQDVPSIAIFMFKNIRLFVFSTMLLSGFGLASAIGLLQRRNWAPPCYYCSPVDGYSLEPCWTPFSIHVFLFIESALVPLRDARRVSNPV